MGLSDSWSTSLWVVPHPPSTFKRLPNFDLHLVQFCVWISQYRPRESACFRVTSPSPSSPSPTVAAQKGKKGRKQRPPMWSLPWNQTRPAGSPVGSAPPASTSCIVLQNDPVSQGNWGRWTGRRWGFGRPRPALSRCYLLFSSCNMHAYYHLYCMNNVLYKDEICSVDWHCSYNNVFNSTLIACELCLYSTLLD